MNNKYINCEFLYEDTIFNLNRVVRLKDGTLFTIASITKKDEYRIGEYIKHQFVFGRISADGGRTWGMPYPLFEIPETKAFVSPADFMISRDGYLHAFILRIKSSVLNKDGTGNSTGDILHARMDDITGKNVYIQKIECLDRYAGSLNNLIQLKNGRLVVPFSTLTGYPSNFVSSTIFSDDEGLTWKASNDINIGSDETHFESGALEPVIVEVRDNTLLMVIRTVLEYFYYSVSCDGGESWSKARPTSIRSSNSPAGLEKLPDGRILVVWNHCYGMPMQGTRYSLSRQCLHAAISDDGLKTINGLRMIVKKEQGDPDDVLNCYPFLDVAGDDSAYIRFAVVNSKEQEDWREPGGKLVRLQTDFLYADGIRSDFAKDKKDWITDYNTTGISDCDGLKGLAVRSGKDEIGYACVNFAYGREGSIKITFRTGAEFKGAKLFFSECYLDRSNFTEDEATMKHMRKVGSTDVTLNDPTTTALGKYIEAVRESYVEIGLFPDKCEGGLAVIPGEDGELEIDWSVEKSLLTAGCGPSQIKIDIPHSFKGFNHMGIILPCVDGNEFVLKGFEEVSTKTGLDTGIEY